MIQEVKGRDKLSVLWYTGLKFARGLYKRLFIKQVKGLFLVGKHVKITHGNHIYCGRNVKFEDFSEIQGLCSEGIRLGDNVTIGRNVMIRPSSYYGIDMGKGLTIGNNSSVGPDGYVGCSGKITIGNNVMFGPKCSLFAENHIFCDVDVSIKSQGVEQKDIVIEDDCWIASNVIILAGVTIGRGSVIGAGTLVTKDVPAGSILTNKREITLRSRT